MTYLHPLYDVFDVEELVSVCSVSIVVTHCTVYMGMYFVST